MNAEVLREGLRAGEDCGHLLTPDDDDFHAPGTGEWFEHETEWMWFFVPERKIGA